MVRRTKEQAAETREQILAAALEVFSRKGYSRTTINDIAREIGHTKGAVYWHFKNKPDLLAAMIRHHESHFCEDLFEFHPETLEQFKAFLFKHARMVADNDEVQKFKFFLYFQIEWSAEFMTKVHKKLNELREDPKEDFIRALTYLKSIGQLREDADVNKIINMLFANWMGTLDLALMKEITFDEFYAYVVENINQIFNIYAK